MRDLSHNTEACAASPLTDQELKVLKLLSIGRLYKEVAQELFISENTVRSHVRHIYSKLSVHSKAEMVFTAMRNSLLSLLSLPFFPFPDNIA
jgi:DNA-binding NarL/FixJ family response regulator